MNVITTKYLAPTNNLGSRVKATTDQEGKNFSKTVNYDHGLSPKENHITAFKVLAYDLKWAGDYCIGNCREGYVFVNKADSDFVSVYR